MNWGQFFWNYSTDSGQPINIPGREGSRFAGQWTVGNSILYELGTVFLELL